MKSLFNHKNDGQELIKELLGFLDADFRFDNIKTDIELNTPDLVNFIGQSMYDKLQGFYVSNQDEADASTLKPILKNAQLYILLTAYVDYAPNADMIHGPNGRKIHFADQEKTPWDWQIAQDTGALKRRAYKALDQLIVLLDHADFEEWKNSDQYQTAKSLFVYNTAEFNKRYPINSSGQLYYRLVPFISDIESEVIRPILGADQYDELKTQLKTNPNADEKELIGICQKISVYRTMERATGLLPDEMFSVAINYKASESERERIKINRKESFAEMARRFEVDLERSLARQQGHKYIADLTHGLKRENKHVNL